MNGRQALAQALQLLDKCQIAGESSEAYSQAKQLIRAVVQKMMEAEKTAEDNGKIPQVEPAVATQDSA